MNLVWKGKYKDESQLAEGELPEEAVQFKEPDSPAKLNLIAALFIIPVMVLVGIVLFLKQQMGLLGNMPDVFNLTGVLLAFLMIIPHEIIHALSFPQEAEVHLWYSLKDVMFFVHSTYPLSKKRFIVMASLPSLIFGVLPLIIWMFIPESHGLSNSVISFATFNLLLGAGDYLNVFNAARQMPKGAVTQLSGFNSYWYWEQDSKQQANE